MKAVGKHLIVQIKKEGTTKTEGGLLLAENQRKDIRYIEATILSVGDEINGLKKDDNIYFERHAGHKLEIDKKDYHVIKAQDIVVIL